MLWVIVLYNILKSDFNTKNDFGWDAVLYLHQMLGNCSYVLLCHLAAGLTLVRGMW